MEVRFNAWRWKRPLKTWIWFWKEDVRWQVTVDATLDVDLAVNQSNLFSHGQGGSPSTSITLSKSRMRSPWGNCSPRTKPATSIHTTQMIQIDFVCILRCFPFGPVADFLEAISQMVGSQATRIKMVYASLSAPEAPSHPKVRLRYIGILFTKFFPE